MSTVFSHIIQKRLPQEYEDVATEALAFIIQRRECARNGIMKLLRGTAPDLDPDLKFRTQQTLSKESEQDLLSPDAPVPPSDARQSEGLIRLDMCGTDTTGQPRVFVENKFWAGLTDNQPVSYLQQLRRCPQTTVLLAVVPEARQETVWREFMCRLRGAQIKTVDREVAANIVHSVTTGIGPILALTSWPKLLSVVKDEIADDPRAMSDLLQLSALCEAADSEAFLPVSSGEVTDQRIPALIRRLGTIVQEAVREGVLNNKGLRPQANWEQIGQYARFSDGRGVGVWFGIHFRLWWKHGRTPLWLVFPSTDFGRARDVGPPLERWASKEGVFMTEEGNDFVVAMDIATGEEKDQVKRAIVDRLKGIAEALAELDPK